MKLPLLAAAFAAAIAFPAAAGTLPADTPLVVDGPIKVDAGDFEGYMLRVPETQRLQVRADYERVATMVDNLFIARSIAAKAREAGLDRDPGVQRRLAQVQESLLADLYLKELDRKGLAVDLEQRARELYNGEKSKYVKPEQVRVQHILVNLQGRTREMALEKAKQLREEAVSGKEDFLALAARHSDDPGKKRNGGELGYNSPNAFVDAVSKQIAQMKKEGEISEPVESVHGFHIIRFVDRRAPRQMSFEEVKKDLIAAERERLAKKRHEDLLAEIRGSQTVTVHRANVEALVTPIDQATLDKAAAAEAQPKR